MTKPIQTTFSQPKITIRIQTQDFDLGAEYAACRTNPNSPNQNGHSIGAIVSFTGLVRDHTHPQQENRPQENSPQVNQHTDAVTGLTLEHYPGMTEQVLHQLAIAAAQRWPLAHIRIIHRIGHLLTHEQIVLVLVASAHRDAAFAAATFLMDKLKTEAPFWKKTHTIQGTEWVAARETDTEAAKRWDV